MARTVTVALEDDLDKGLADETVRFWLGVVACEIHLSEKNAVAFRRKLALFIDHARKAGTGQRGRTSVSRVPTVTQTHLSASPATTCAALGARLGAALVPIHSATAASNEKPLRSLRLSHRIFISSTTAPSAAAVAGVIPNSPGPGIAKRPCTTPSFAVSHVMPA